MYLIPPLEYINILNALFSACKYLMRVESIKIMKNKSCLEYILYGPKYIIQSTA